MITDVIIKVSKEIEDHFDAEYYYYYHYHHNLHNYFSIV